METITYNSVAQTLFNTFKAVERKHDYRTSRGKFFKSLQDNAYVTVKVGVADLIVEKYDYENYEVTNTRQELVPYNVLNVSLDVDINEVLDTVEAYLREVAPTRELRDSESNKHIVPNIVRIATDWVYVEDIVDGWQDKDAYYAYGVWSFELDPLNQEQLSATYEVVDREHYWKSNPFITEDSWRKRDDNIGELSQYRDIFLKLDNHRRSHAEAQRRGVLITECQVAGRANRSYGYDTAVKSLEAFIAKFNASDDTEAPRYAIQNAFNVAYETALVRVSEYFLSVVGKTSWEVSSNTFTYLGRNSYYRTDEERLNERPVFIDEVVAYALTVEWFVKDDWDRTPPEAKGEVLKRFTEAVKGYYR